MFAVIGSLGKRLTSLRCSWWIARHRWPVGYAELDRKQDRIRYCNAALVCRPKDKTRRSLQCRRVERRMQRVLFDASGFRNWAPVLIQIQAQRHVVLHE